MFAKSSYQLCQLDGGSRLRPTIAFLGHLINNQKDSSSIKHILKLGVSIEMIHKASLLIDDIVDGDQLRNGKETFHVVNGIDKALTMATFLIGKAYSGFADTFYHLDKNHNTDKYFILSADILKDMSEGLMMELEMIDFSGNQISTSAEIIRKETSSIIKNALVLGYLLGSEENLKITESLNVIGELCGYMFQVMNDIEPFGDSTKRILNKGDSINEFYFNRKNIVVSYITHLLGEEERLSLFDVKDPKRGSDILIEYFYELKVWPHFLDEFGEISDLIHKKIQILKNEGVSDEWCSNCESFIEALVNIAKGKMYLR